jgi:hypothetical protein
VKKQHLCCSSRPTKITASCFDEEAEDYTVDIVVTEFILPVSRNNLDAQMKLLSFYLMTSSALLQH